MIVSDHFPDPDDFTDLLSLAEGNASTDWEVDFIDNLIDKFITYGTNAYLSEKQVESLRRIAEDEDLKFL